MTLRFLDPLVTPNAVDLRIVRHGRDGSIEPMEQASVKRKEDRSGPFQLRIIVSIILNAGFDVHVAKPVEPNKAVASMLAQRT